MFVISVYDLKTGDEVYHAETNSISESLHLYELAVKHYRNYCTDDCFGVMLYTESGNIIYGFGADF